MKTVRNRQFDAGALNSDCDCITLDRAKLADDFDNLVGETGFGQQLLASHPTLLSNQPLFLAHAHRSAIERAVSAIEAVIASPAYQTEVLSQATELCRHNDRMHGLFMGYDFHIGADGPKLIEINTNAGGALINEALYRAQAACCAAAMPFLALISEPKNYGEEFLQAFRQEWRNFDSTTDLRRIAIVDTAPETQFLYPEFVLFKRLFEREGIEALIASPDQLQRRMGSLWIGSKKIDLVYNRLTDFTLETSECLAMRAAYLADEVALTPNPRLHALYADKRNLTRLGDVDQLRRLGVPEKLALEVSAVVPRSVVVDQANRDDVWQRRNQLFFKPASGYGSKAAYRGDKMTKRVWETVLNGSYIAQDLVPPSIRHVIIGGERHPLKVDVRAYVYAGKIQLMAARLYQGQTTNMRTPGGGFSPVLSVPPAFEKCCA